MILSWLGLRTWTSLNRNLCLLTHLTEKLTW